MVPGKLLPALLGLSLSIGFFLNQQAVADDQEDFGTVVRQFSTVRHQSEEDLAKALSLPVSKDVEDFFKAAEAGDSQSVSNHFLKMLTGPANPVPRAEYRNELWAPIHETLGLYEVYDNWKKNTALLKAFADPIVASMPAGSIYFGGTDPGRFLPTAVSAIQHPLPVFCITQNALADTTYMTYLRTVDGKQIWIPATEDCQRAFQQYVNDVQDRHVRGVPVDPAEDVDLSGGRVQVRGVTAVMKINGILCRFIHDHNKDQHEFYVEESYVLDWMYPYLEPHGLIMKLNKEPLAELSPAMIAGDTTFWKEKTEWLLKQPGFADNQWVRLSFAKLRCAIARIYVSRKLDDEARRALQQALQIGPRSPEANLELADLYERHAQIDQAIDLLKAFIPIAPEPAIQDATRRLKKLENKRPLAPDEQKQLLDLVQQLGAGQFKLRQEARQKIADFGPRALLVLRDQANNQDPEISGAVGDLIDQFKANDRDRIAH